MPRSRQPSNRGYDMVDSGKPIKFVIPSEGASIGMVSFHIAKNSPNADICKKFINFALSKRPQEDFGNGMNAGPTTSYAVLNDKARSRVPPIHSMLLFDWFKLVPQMGALADRWNSGNCRLDPALGSIASRMEYRQMQCWCCLQSLPS